MPRTHFPPSPLKQFFRLLQVKNIYSSNFKFDEFILLESATVPSSKTMSPYLTHTGKEYLFFKF